MTNRRRLFSRSIQEMSGIADSALLEHPAPDDLEKAGSALPGPLFDDPFLTQWNYSNEDIFERRDSCPPGMGKREASYGSLLSILSENSSQTISTCSFDDEPENSSEHVQSKLDRVDSLLYEGKCCENMNEKLKEDCCTWSKMFPHFRINGTSLQLHPYSEDCEALDGEILDEDVNIMDEVIEEHCEPVDSASRNEEEETDKEDDIKMMQRIQEKVLAKLVEHLVAVTIEWNAATSEKTTKPLRIRTATASRDRSQLRPMTAVESHRSVLPPVLPTTFRPLEGILVVSSKVLQNRSAFSYLSRPGSSVTRVKTADQGASRAQLLKNRLSKLANNLENIEEGKTSQVAIFSPPNPQNRLFRVDTQRELFGILQDQTEAKETKNNNNNNNNRDRPFSLPPVHAATNDPSKVLLKKSPPVQKLATGRQRFQGQQMGSRPPSGRDVSKPFLGEQSSMLTVQEPLPSVSEENFLKIRPITRTSVQMRTKSSSLHPLSARHRKT